MLGKFKALVAWLLGASGIVFAADELPLFDAHLHYSGDAWEQFPPEKVMQLLDEANIDKALLSSTPIEGALRLYEHAPQRFIPELRVYRQTTSLATWFQERQTWYKDPGTIAFLEAELKRGIYKGIGEFHVNGDEIDTPVMRGIAGLAVAHNILLHAHSDDSAIAKLFEFNPKVRVIWAHTGMSTPLATIDAFLERYPNLWFELSYRSDVVSGGALNPAWRERFLKYPRRFLWGSDTWTPARWPEVPALAAQARAWLRELPPAVAEQIAFKNAQTLFGF